MKYFVNVLFFKISNMIFSFLSLQLQIKLLIPNLPS